LSSTDQCNVRDNQGTARYLIHVAPRGALVTNRPELMRRLRDLGIHVINIRIGSNHIEVDALSRNIGADADIIDKAIGSVTRIIPLNEENEVENPFKAFIELFNEERFWEAHEVLEGVWRANRDTRVQGLIVLAAAFAKLQEESLTGFQRLMQRSLDLMAGSHQVDCISIDRIRELINEAIRSRRPFRIHCKNNELD